MKIPSKTTLREMLVLGRIQSVPLTVVPLAAGYGAVTGDIFTIDMLSLAVIGALAHLGVFAQNDIVDMDYDMRQGREDKPLVKGTLDVPTAGQFSFSTIILSLIISMFTSDLHVTGLMALAAIIGSVYNFTSKETPLGPPIMVAWGVVIVAIGSLFAGDYNLTSMLIGGVVGIHMAWIIIQGDYKDLYNGEDGLPQRLGVSLEVQDVRRGTERKYTAINKSRLIALSIAIVMVESVLVYLIFIEPGEFVTNLAVLAGIMALLVFPAMMIFSLEDHVPERLKKRIVIHNALAVVVVSVALSSVISSYGVVAIGGGTVVWGLGWQKILYGRALYFP